jgi:hypothetical protein
MIATIDPIAPRLKWAVLSHSGKAHAAAEA